MYIVLSYQVEYKRGHLWNRFSLATTYVLNLDMLYFILEFDRLL
ncbi:unnamed protein product [Spirodela intermedia]|uniref:Uncharacterized protein n=1 Tax=Spirodela intermedia TaxID=51605 RepID=A0A7I8KCT6_SPIIN|nr:unnamed protein product [Spirodela intermedia]